MQNNRHIILLLLIFFITQIVSSQTIPQNEKLIKGTLENGMTYYIYQNDYPKNEAIFRLFIKSGSLYEEEHQRGLAHFLEHMAFNGTKNFPKNGIVDFLETKGAKFGADINAHTSYNETVYKLQVPSADPQVIDSTLIILSDWANDIIIDKEDVDDERGVILSEWLAKRDAKRNVNDALLDMLMNNSRFSERVVIGDTSVIKNAKAQDLRDYYEKWYRPDLMAVAVVGDINPDTIELRIRKLFSTQESENRGEPPYYGIPDYNKVDGRIIINKSLKEPELMFFQLGDKASAVRTESDYTSYLNRNLINRLFKNRLNELSFDNTYYSNSSIGFTDFLNTKTLLMGTVKLIPGKTREGISKFITDLNQIYNFGFTEIEISKIKKQYLQGLKLKATEDSPVSSSSIIDEIYADFYKDYVVTTPKDEYELALRYINDIDSVSVLKSLDKYVDIEKTNYLFTSFTDNDFSDKDEMLSLIDLSFNKKTVPYFINVDIRKELLTKEPKVGKITSKTQIEGIDATELILSNGVKVIYKPSVSGKNRINISAFKKGGLYALDSTDYISGMFAPSVVGLSGAGALNRDELSYHLAGNSASVRLLIEKTRTGMVAGASTADLETLFKLIYAKWVMPNADKSVFDLTKEIAIENYQKQNKTDKKKYYEELGYLLKGRDYVTDELKDDRIQEELVYDKILPIFNSFYGNAYGFTFVIISDISIEELTPYLEKYIASLPSYETNLKETEYKYKGGDIRVDSTSFVRQAGDSERAVVALIFQKDSIPDSLDRYSLKSQIADNVIKIRLINEIREKMGLIYSISVSSGATLYPKELSRSTISFTASTDDVDLIIKKIEQLLDSMIFNHSSFNAELEKVKTNLKNEVLTQTQRNLYWSSFIRNTVFNEQYNWNYHKKLDNMLENITSKDISDIILYNFNIKNRVKAVLLPK